MVMNADVGQGHVIALLQPMAEQIVEEVAWKLPTVQVRASPLANKNHFKLDAQIELQVLGQLCFRVKLLSVDNLFVFIFCKCVTRSSRKLDVMVGVVCLHFDLWYSVSKNSTEEVRESRAEVWWSCLCWVCQTGGVLHCS